METITFHFHSNSNFFSRLIEWRTGSRISHVSIEVRGYYYNAYIESRFSRTQDIPSDILESYSFTVDRSIVDEAVVILEDLLGDLYDVKSVIGFIFNTNKQSKGRVYCSEVANTIFELIVPGKVQYDKLISPEMVRLAVVYFIKGTQAFKTICRKVK